MSHIPLIIILITFFHLSTLTSLAQKFDDEEPVRIGFVIDGDNNVFNEIEKSIKQEISALVSNKYKMLEFPEEKKKISNFTSAGINSEIDKMFADPEVDILIGIGTITSVNLAGRGIKLNVWT